MHFSRFKHFFLIYSIALASGVTWNLIPVSGDLLTALPYKITYFEFGNLYLIFILGAIIFCSICGIFGTRINLHKMMIFSISGLIVGCLLTTIIDIIPNYAFIYLCMGMLGLGLGTGGILISLSKMTLKYSAKYKTSSLVLLFAFLGIGSALSPFFIEVFAFFKPISVSFSIFVVIYSIQLFLICRNHQFIYASPNAPHLNLIKDISSSWKLLPFQFWLIAICVFLYSIMEISFWDWGTIYLNQAKNLSRSLIDLSSSFYWIAATLSDIIFSFLFIRFDYKKYYSFIPILIFITYLLLIFSYSKKILIFSMALAGFSCAPFFPLTVRLADEKIPEVETKAFGILLGIYFLGAGISSYLIGIFKGIFSFEFETIYSALSLGALIILILIIYSNKSFSKRIQ